MSSRYDLNAPIPVMAPVTLPRDQRRPVPDEDLLSAVDADYTIRKRRVWSPEEDDSLASEDIDLLDDDDELEEEEDDGVGCPLPSTPEDTQLLEAEMTEVLKAGVLSDEIDLGALAHNAAEQAEEFVRKVWEASWKVCHFKHLPAWLQDNDFLHKGHRPPLPSI